MKSHQIHPSRLVLLLVCLLASITFAQAQQTPDVSPPDQEDEDVLRISTELVQTDVVVLDKQGRFVGDLKPEQFQLKIDGKPQPITFFERVTAWNANEEQKLAAARGEASISTTSEAPAVAAPVKRGRTVIFFVDDVHLYAASIPRVRRLLLNFIDKQMDKDDVVAISSPTGSIGFLQQFTNNKTVLRAAVDRITYQPNTVDDGQKPPMSEYQATLIERGDRDLTQFFVEQTLFIDPGVSPLFAGTIVKKRAQLIVMQSSIRNLRMLRSLDSLMRSSMRMPGRKLAFFISDGFIADNSNFGIQDVMKRMTTTAARAGVVIYTIHARGLTTDMDDATTAEAFDAGGKNARVMAMLHDTHEQDVLVTIANDTGGRSLLHSNALEPAVTRALDEMSHYYLLAWRPDPEANSGGKFRRLEVSIVGRPDLKVRMRRGFLGGETKPSGKEASGKAPVVKTVDDEMREAVNGLLPKTGIPLALAVNYLNTPDKVSLLTFAMKIPSEALTYEQMADIYAATVDVLGGVYDEKGKPVSSFKDRLKVNANSSDPTELQHNQVVYTSEVPLKPGLYQVRIATRDAQSKRLGSATEWVEIPDLTKGKLTMSSLFISELKAGETKTDEEALKPANLSIDHRFAKTSKLLFFTYIYNASHGANTANAPDVAIQVQVLSGLKSVIKTQSLKVSTEGVTDPARLSYSAAIPLASLAAGRYTLQITVTDRVAQKSATQDVSFEVK